MVQFSLYVIYHNNIKNAICFCEKSEGVTKKSWRRGAWPLGGLVRRRGKARRSASPAGFSSTYRTEGPAGLLITNLLSESQAAFRCKSTCRLRNVRPLAALQAARGLSVGATRRALTPPCPVAALSSNNSCPNSGTALPRPDVWRSRSG